MWPELNQTHRMRRVCESSLPTGPSDVPRLAFLLQFQPFHETRSSPIGIDLITAFYGCLYAGCVPITVRPPHPQNIATTLPTVRMIVEVTAPDPVGQSWALGREGGPTVSGQGLTDWFRKQVPTFACTWGYRVSPPKSSSPEAIPVVTKANQVKMPHSL